MKVRFSKIVDLIGFVIVIILWINKNTFLTALVRFLESAIVPDHHIRPENVAYISFLYTMLMIGILLFAVLHFTGILKKALNNTVHRLIDLPKLIRFFTEDAISPRLSRDAFYIGCAGVFVLYFFYHFLGGVLLAKSENPIETVTSFFFLIAAMVLLLSSYLVGKATSVTAHQNQVRFALIALSIVLFFIFGEEVSWGQHWMGWEATGVFETNNFQKETNLHNFFNPIFNLVYPLVGAGLFLAGTALWVFPKSVKSGLSMILTPHPSLFPILFAASFYSFRGHSEIFEEYLGLLFLLYSLRIYLGLRVQ